MDDLIRQQVLEANQSFYDAHENGDFAAMETLWERSDRVVCIHPGWPILRGWYPVMESWQRIMSGPTRNTFILTNIAVFGDGATATVTLDENLVEGSSTATIAATNMFIRSSGDWRLVLHHGSPVMG